MKHIAILPLLLCLNFATHGKDKASLSIEKPNSMELGLLGTGTGLSLHYGRILSVKPAYHSFALRAIQAVARFTQISINIKITDR